MSAPHVSVWISVNLLDFDANKEGINAGVDYGNCELLLFSEPAKINTFLITACGPDILHNYTHAFTLNLILKQTNLNSCPAS